jgi:hypothetical protein
MSDEVGDAAAAKATLIKDSATDERRQRRLRAVAAVMVIYVAIIAISAATYFAYPDLMYSRSARAAFFQENYQAIVGFSAAIAGIITLGMLSPGAPQRLLTALFPFFRKYIDAIDEPAKLTNRSVDQGAIRSAIQSALSEFTVDDEADDVLEYNVDVIFAEFSERMKEEQRRLKQNSFTNLSWGIVFAIFSFGILGYPLVTPESGPVATDWMAFLNRFGPRASLGLLVGVISFFFLRLYASNEYDLKHNKNEITTFESKMLALKWAEAARPGKLSEIILTHLMKSERNFILKKGERTVSGEIDNNYNDLKDLILEFGRMTKSRTNRTPKAKAEA